MTHNHKKELVLHIIFAYLLCDLKKNITSNELQKKSMKCT